MTITRAIIKERRIKLVLYTSPNAVLSARAVRNMEQILADYDEAAVAFEVCDISRDPAAAAREGITFTPALVKRFPGPLAWILGDLDEPSIVRRMLDGAGAPRKTSSADADADADADAETDMPESGEQVAGVFWPLSRI
jgi:hypothetical protein